MSWVRIDCDVPMDGRLCASGHAWAWPAVVARAKAGDGRIKMRECTARIMAYLWGPSMELWEMALSHFLDSGLLVEDGDAYVVAGWDEYQRDNTGAERQRKHRASRRVTPSHAESRDVTSSNGDVTLRHVTSRDGHAYSTGHTVQDIQDIQVAADAAPPRTQGRAHEAAAAAPPPDGLAAALERWRLALRGRSGAAPLVVGSLDAEAIMAAVTERGAEYVTRCIDRAAEVAGGGGPSLALLGRIIAEGIHDSARPVRAPSGGRGAPARGKSVNAAWATVQEPSEEGERW